MSFVHKMGRYVYPMMKPWNYMNNTPHWERERERVQVSTAWVSCIFAMHLRLASKVVTRSEVGGCEHRHPGTDVKPQPTLLLFWHQLKLQHLSAVLYCIVLYFVHYGSNFVFLLVLLRASLPTNNNFVFDTSLRLQITEGRELLTIAVVVRLVARPSSTP